MPAEVANGVKPEAIVKAMTESFRQQTQKTGLQETQTLLSAATTELKRTTKDLADAIETDGRQNSGTWSLAGGGYLESLRQ